jgi:hypothetical protein
MNNNREILTTFKKLDENDDKPIRSASAEFDINNNNNRNNKQSPIIDTRNVGAFKQIWQSNNPNFADKTISGNNNMIISKSNIYIYFLRDI